jgi:AcrR family transcriptional regulator
MPHTYDAPRRRAQALATRARVLASAQRRFTADGYARASMATIATDAGVSDRLLYKLFGSKRGLLLALLEEFAPVPRDVFEARVAAADSAAAQLAIAVEFVTAYFAAAADLLSVTIPAAGTDADLRTFVEQGEMFRRFAQRPLVDQWAAAGVLRGGLSADQAADALWALTSPEVYLKLRAAGWGPTQIQGWLTQTLAEALLRAP